MSIQSTSSGLASKKTAPAPFPSINFSKNAVLIHLENVRLEDIVEQKLCYFLQQRPLGRQILKTFSEPAEKAIIELYLEKNCGNQLRTAYILGINRNTLKKKISNYKLDIQKILTIEKKLSCFQNRVFIGSLPSLNLFYVCHIKLLLDSSNGKLPSADVLDQLYRPVERKIIQTVLNYCNGNQIRASQFLGINRNTLKKKMGFKSKVKAV